MLAEEKITVAICTEGIQGYFMGSSINNTCLLVVVGNVKGNLQ